jgi:dipeptidase D
MAIQNLAPSILWQNFANLNSIPRASGDEGRVCQFIRDFATKHNLTYKEDKVGNIVIYKSASKGLENRATMVMQGHLDMVHEANAGTKFDFNTQGIDMIIDGDIVKANNTTLGADNGIGVAAIMAFLETTTLAHPPIEALFTIDEERGLTGALNLEKGLLKGKRMLNLDTEEDHVFSIGCAGGLDTVIDWTYKTVPVVNGSTGYTIKIAGLTGGHSGMEINKGLGNAHKILNRVLMNCQTAGIMLGSWTGGGKRNAIPRESTAVVAVKRIPSFTKQFKAIRENILAEFLSIEPNITISFEASPLPATLMSPKDVKRLLLAVRSTHNGVFRMSPDVAGLVETSNNLAKITIADGHAKFETLQRSSIESGKTEVADAVSAPFELIGAKINRFGSYPGWKPNPKSALVKKMATIYEREFSKPPTIEALHAGLECGIIGGIYPQLDMISFGPNIWGAHAPTECVSISSVQKFWTLLTKVMAEI